MAPRWCLLITTAAAWGRDEAHGICKCKVQVNCLTVALQTCAHAVHYVAPKLHCCTLVKTTTSRGASQPPALRTCSASALLQMASPMESLSCR